MISTGLMIVILLQYALIAAASAWERNWPRFWYYVGAIILSLAVLSMSKKGTP